MFNISVYFCSNFFSFTKKENFQIIDVDMSQSEKFQVPTMKGWVRIFFAKIKVKYKLQTNVCRYTKMYKYH